MASWRSDTTQVGVGTQATLHSDLLRFELRWADPGRFFILRQFGGVIRRLDASNYPPWVGVRVGVDQIAADRAETA